jgi:hypothetical protein
MFKRTTLILLAGLATVLTTLPSQAQFARANVPGGPNHPVGKSAEHCSDQMGHMRRVNRADIQAIHNQPVYLIPICEDLRVFAKNNYGALFVNGNVERLRVPIARNATLMAALRARGYDQHDVVSLRFGGNDSIILYVHQRDMN